MQWGAIFGVAWGSGLTRASLASSAVRPARLARQLRVAAHCRVLQVSLGVRREDTMERPQRPPRLRCGRRRGVLDDVQVLNDFGPWGGTLRGEMTIAELIACKTLSPVAAATLWWTIDRGRLGVRRRRSAGRRQVDRCQRPVGVSAPRCARVRHGRRPRPPGGAGRAWSGAFAGQRAERPHAPVPVWSRRPASVRTVGHRVRMLGTLHARSASEAVRVMCCEAGIARAQIGVPFVFAVISAWVGREIVRRVVELGFLASDGELTSLTTFESTSSACKRMASTHSPGGLGSMPTRSTRRSQCAPKSWRLRRSYPESANTCRARHSSARSKGSNRIPAPSQTQTYEESNSRRRCASATTSSSPARRPLPRTFSSTSRSDLLDAYDRFFVDPAKSDPQCLAKHALAQTLHSLDYGADVRGGIGHVQLEPAWGGRADTAASLRGTCARALTDCFLDDLVILRYLTHALADTDKTVRIDAAIAIDQLNRPKARFCCG